MNDATVDLTKQLIARPSVSPDDQGCQDLLIERLQKIGFTITKLPFEDVKNVWATRGSAKPLVVFAGHTDVVPPGPLDQWHSDPFEPTIRDGNLYGRGAADMKSGLAAMITAAERFVQNNPDHEGSIAFLITSDEEAHAINGTRKVVEHLLKQNVQIDYCIIGEASSDQQFGDTIKNGRRGSLSAKLMIKGVQGHIAYPQLASNPIHNAAPFLQAICDVQWDQGNDHFPATSFQMSNIHAGTGANNVIPGELIIDFNFRYSTEVTVEQLQQRTEQVLKDQQLDYDINWHHSGDPFLTEPGKLTTALTRAIEKVSGIKAQLSTSGGTSDGRFIAKMDCQVVEFGPINASIHKINEHINVKNLLQLSLIYEQTLTNILVNSIQ